MRDRRSAAGLLGGVLILLGRPDLLFAKEAIDFDGFSINGSLRVRAEAIDGQTRATGNISDQMIESRAIVRLGWRRGAVRIVTETWDSRAWGANPGTPLSTGEVNTLEPVQAYIEVDLPGIAGLGHGMVRAGRFSLALGSSRLVAADEYRNTVNAFTGLRGDLATKSGWAATLFYAQPVRRLPDDSASLRKNRQQLDSSGGDAVLWGGLLSRQARGSAVLSEVGFLRLTERDAPGLATRDRRLSTLSLRLLQAPQRGRVDAAAEAMYQWGTTSAAVAPSARRLAVSATNLRLQLGYSFAGPGKAHVQLELDRASGDGPGGTYGRFDPLFGARRAELAPSGLYAAVIRSNLVSPGIRFEGSPTARLEVMALWRGLWLDSQSDAFSGTGIVDVTGGSGRFAGHQFDLRLRQWIVPARLRFELNALLLAKGGFLRNAPNARPGKTTRYGSLNLMASF